ncbi:MAG: YybH family protein [Acidimicrobiia bacterium]
MTEKEFAEALKKLDDAFRSGRSPDFIDFFAEDSRVLWHNQGPIEGREAVREAFQQVFGMFDTSAYEPEYDIVDVIGDQAYVLGSFREVLRPHEGGSSVHVSGRIVLFWRRTGGRWLVTRMLTARSASEQVED